MTRRSKEWDETLAEELKDKEFAKEYILACLEEGEDLQTTIGKVVRCLGVKDFAKKVKMASSNLVRAIDRRHNPTQETLNRLLKPFGLQLAVMDLQKTGNRKAS